MPVALHLGQLRGRRFGALGGQHDESEAEVALGDGMVRGPAAFGLDDLFNGNVAALTIETHAALWPAIEIAERRIGDEEAGWYVLGSAEAHQILVERGIAFHGGSGFKTG